MSLLFYPMQKKNVKRKVPKIETVSFPLKNIENKKLGNALTFRDFFYTHQSVVFGNFFYYIGRLSKSKKVGLWSLLDTSRQAQKVPKKPVFFGGEACFKVGKRVSGDRSAFDVDLRLCKGLRVLLLKAFSKGAKCNVIYLPPFCAGGCNREKVKLLFSPKLDALT